ncbi:MAG: TerC family protein [Planctomycetota bacterium]
MDLSWLLDPTALTALLTLTVLEVVLGIDNVIFIAILSGKLPKEQQAKARQIGLALAMITRILLLCSLAWIMKLTDPLFPSFNILGKDIEISGRDLILLVGGLFLLGKSTLEIHDKLEGHSHESGTSPKKAGFSAIVTQIAILDIVFSLDSVITAVGMADRIAVMITAVIIAVAIMMLFAGSISNFVDRHPTVKILALSFLLLIGMSLVGEGLKFHIPKGYIYFSMAFSVFVEMINIRIRTKSSKPVKLHKPIE